MALKSIKWFFFCPATLVVCIFGLIFNIFSILVWRRLRKKGRPNNKTVCLYFITLSILDMLVLVFSIISDVMPTMLPKLSENELFGRLFIYVIHPLHFYFLFTSIFLVTVLSIERLKFIIDPLSRFTVSKSWSGALLMSVFFISAVVNIPSFFEFELAKQNNGTVTRIQPLDYKEKTSFRNIVFFSHCIFGLAIPWLITFICNLILVNKAFSRFRSSTHATVNSDTIHILKTTTAVTFSTLLLLSFQCISRCFKMFVLSENDPQWIIIQKAANIGHLAIPLNSAINFLMFCLPGSYFRKELVLMFCKKKQNVSGKSRRSTSDGCSDKQASESP